MQLLTDKPKKRKRAGRGRKGEGSLKLRGNIYWYIIPGPVPGTKISKSCETSDRDIALAKKAQALVDSKKPARAVTGSVLISDVLDEYAKYAEHECARSWRSIKCQVSHVRAALGHLYAADLTTAHTDRYRENRIREDGVTDSTVNRDLGSLCAALKREMETTPPRVSFIPFMRFPSEKDRVREGFINREDGYPAILAELPECLKAIFVCAFHTGARAGELKMIRWEQVNFELGIIELTPKTTKNGDGRWIPIWGDMREYLLRQKKTREREQPNCPWVFFWQEGHHSRAEAGERLGDFRDSWGNAVEAAGFPGVLFHDLRRSAIRYADQEAKMSSIRVRGMSGHKTESVYNRYNIVGGKDIQQLGRELDAYLAKERKAKVIRMKGAA